MGQRLTTRKKIHANISVNIDVSTSKIMKYLRWICSRRLNILHWKAIRHRWKSEKIHKYMKNISYSSIRIINIV